jgi:TonB family protein
VLAFGLRNQEVSAFVGRFESFEGLHSKLASQVHSHQLGLFALFGGASDMTHKLWTATLGLTVILGGSLVWVQHSAAQAQQEEMGSKRKVKSRVVPSYPDLAHHMNVSGKVRIEVVIKADGRVKSTHVLGGHPLLAQSATDALKEWRFEPAPSDTTEIIEFVFKAPQD